LPEKVARSLTQTVDGEWVIWASKVAWIDGTQFRALTGSEYPWDAIAACHRDPTHAAPVRSCSCGFHAVSDSKWGRRSLGLFRGAPTNPGRSTASLLRRRADSSVTSTMEIAALSVSLTGHVLAFEWMGDAVLFRAQRQTIAQVHRVPSDERQPDDPTGTLARTTEPEPAGAGPMRLQLPESLPASIIVADDAGYCLTSSAARVTEANGISYESTASERRLVTT
jgi:hypothetical protein